MKKQIKTFDQLKDSRLLYDKKLPPFGYFIITTVLFLLLFVVIWSIKTPKIYMITSQGVVESENKNYIMSPYTGEIADMKIKEGSVVQKGDPLFTIKSTEMDVQSIQLTEQQTNYQSMMEQYEKLVKSIQDDTNYFDATNPEDSLYYSQFEAYKSQVGQSQVDTSTYKAYGYSKEQIEAELIKNQSKVSEIYYNGIQSAERSIQESKTQLQNIEAQQKALESGQGTYTIKANTAGIVHMMTNYEEGMVVQATAAIGSIASAQDEYQIIAYVSTRDAARTHIGDHVDIVVTGLTQSIYGTLTGKVTNIDSDLTTPEGKNGEENNSYRKIYIKPENNYLISKEGNKVNLTNGQAIEARIQYDEITYFYYVMEALGVLIR